MAQEKSFRDIQVRSSEIEVRTVALNDLWQSLKEGYNDFNATPAVGMFLTVLLYLLFALLLTLVLVGKNLHHLAFPIVAGFTLIGPVVSVGLFEMSRRREHGLDVSWRSTFDFVHSASFAPILALSLNFGDRLSVAPGQTGKRRYSGRRFDQSSNLESYGDGGLGTNCCGAAGGWGNRVFDRSCGGPTDTGPCNLASLPQGRSLNETRFDFLAALALIGTSVSTAMPPYRRTSGLSQAQRVRHANANTLGVLQEALSLSTQMAR